MTVAVDDVPLDIIFVGNEIFSPTDKRQSCHLGLHVCSFLAALLYSFKASNSARVAFCCIAVNFYLMTSSRVFVFVSGLKSRNLTFLCICSLV
jgi:hypothetical protein